MELARRSMAKMEENLMGRWDLWGDWDGRYSEGGNFVDCQWTISKLVDAKEWLTDRVEGQWRPHGTNCHESSKPGSDKHAMSGQLCRAQVTMHPTKISPMYLWTRWPCNRCQIFMYTKANVRNDICSHKVLFGLWPALLDFHDIEYQWKRPKVWLSSYQGFRVYQDHGRKLLNCSKA